MRVEVVACRPSRANSAVAAATRRRRVSARWRAAAPPPAPAAPAEPVAGPDPPGEDAAPACRGAGGLKLISPAEVEFSREYGGGPDGRRGLPRRAAARAGARRPA